MVLSLLSILALHGLRNKAIDERERDRSKLLGVGRKDLSFLRSHWTPWSVASEQQKHDDSLKSL